MAVFLRNNARRVLVSFFFCYLLVFCASAQVGTGDIIPPSPTAASLGTMDMIPAGLYTGSIAPSIPLGTVSSRSLSLDLALSYSSSGFRPADAAPWTGLGWNLNIGGVISRAARGMPDDKQGRGYFDNSYRIPSNPYLFTSTYTERLSYAAGLIDLEPDIFSYSTPGSSGKIIFTDNEGVLQPFLQPSSNIRVQMLRNNSWIEGFVLTSDEGIKYYYGVSSDRSREAIEYTESESISGTMPSIELYPSSWFLVEIISADNTDTLAIHYSDNLLETRGFMQGKTIRVLRGIDALGDNACAETIHNESSSIVTHYTCKPDMIKSSGGEVIFHRSASRLDIPGGTRLDKLEFKNINGSSLQSINMHYSYFGGESAKTESRLRLDSLQVSGGEIELPPYIFDYHSSVPLAYNSNSYDHWGYFNGAINQEQLPAVYPDINAPFTGASRSSSAFSSQSTVLKSIIYPTGGSTSFEYEGHDYGYDGTSLVDNPLYKRVTARVIADADNSPDGAKEEIDFSVPFSQLTTVNIFLADRTGFVEGFVGDVHIRDDSGNIVAQYSTGVRPDTIFDEAGLPKELNYRIYESLYLSGPASYTLEANVGMIDNYASAGISWNIPNDDPEQTGARTSVCGGVRIKKVTMSDNITGSPDIITQYKYRCKNDTLRSSGVLASGSPLYYYPQFVPQFSGVLPLKSGKSGILSLSLDDNAGDNKGDLPVYSGNCEYRVYTQNNLVYNHFTSGSHVGYKEVQVIHGLDGEFGWEEYIYTSPYEYPPQRLGVYPFPPTESYSWKHGLLLKKTVYNASKSRVESIEQQWDIPSGNEQNSHVAGGVKVCFLMNVGIQGLDSISVEPYHFETGWVKLDRKVHIVDGVRQVNNYSYNDNYMLQTLVQSFASDGSEIEERVSYPFDIKSDVYNDMTAANMISFPIEELKLKGGKFVGGSLSTWSRFGDLLKPSGTFLLKIKEPLSALTPFRGTVGSHYRLMMKIDKYDHYGNIAQISRPGDIPTSYIWAYKGNNPVAEIKGMSYNDALVRVAADLEDIDKGTFEPLRLFETLDNDDAMLNILKWDPGRGVVRSIDPTALSRYYEYDDLGRLLAVYDNNRDVELIYHYNYARVPNQFAGASVAMINGLGLSDQINSVAQFSARQNGLDYNDLLAGFSAERFSGEVQYMDGFGREAQLNMIMASPWGEDLVSVKEYDAYGNLARSSLPFISVGDASYVNDYIGALSRMDIYNDDIPWSSLRFEKRANARLLEKGSPGNFLQLGGGHTIRNLYGSDPSNIEGLKYSSELDAAVKLIFPSNTLFMTETKDEDGRKSVEYRDLSGNIIIHRRIGVSDDHTTFFLYDDLGRLRMVVPPGAEGSADSLSLIYKYDYDEYGRRILSNLPGQEAPIVTGYDDLDRPVLSRDARGLEVYTVYDRFSRIIEKGYKEAGSAHVRQKLYYDNYFSIGDNSGLSSLPPGVSTNNKGRLMQKINFLSGESAGFYESYAYDDKGRLLLHAQGSPAGVSKQISLYDFAGNMLQDRSSFTGNNAWGDKEYEMLLENSYLDNNLLSDKECSISSSGQSGESWLLEKNIYDVVGRLDTRTFHNNTQLTNYKYNIRNQLSSIETGSGFGMDLYYDDPGALENIVEQYGGNISALSWRSASFGEGAYIFDYDDYNRMIAADWHGPGTDSLYSTTYKYDRGGNLLELKRNGQGDTGEVETLNDFAYLYKGNQLSSLIRANEKEYMVWPGDIDNNGIVEIDDLLDFGLVYSRSSEGVKLNDRTLSARDSVSIQWEGMRVYKREGDTMIYVDSDGSGLIDLADTLAIHNNLGREHLQEDGQDFVVTYKYDASGNMIYDSYKRMKVSYNCINLPDTIDFPGRGQIVMRYWPSGTMYDRRVFDSGDSLISSTIYSGAFIFENDSLKQIRNSAGYIRPVKDGFSQYYIYADHLGNTRLITNEDGLSISEYNYYPFGLINNSLSLNKDYEFRYNGKEEVEDFGLNWMAYGARMYDAEIGRWHVQDPEGEGHVDYTPYHYTFNNPINYIDPFGMDTTNLNRRVFPDAIDIGEVVIDSREVRKLKKKKERKQTSQMLGILLSSSIGGWDNGYYAKYILFKIEGFDLWQDFLGKVAKGTKYKKPRPGDPVKRSLKELGRYEEDGSHSSIKSLVNDDNKDLVNPMKRVNLRAHEVGYDTVYFNSDRDTIYVWDQKSKGGLSSGTAVNNAANKDYIWNK